MTDRAVTELGLDGIGADLDGLHTAYRRWCRSVPFDSLQKRIFQSRGATGALPGSTGAAFLAAWLEHGTGGSCWSTSLGLHAILQSLGFDARLCAGVMLTDPDHRPNHGSIVVRVDAADWLVDTSMLFDLPLEMPSGTTSVSRDHPVHPVSATGRDDHWIVGWRPAHADVVVECEIARASCDPAVWRAAHETTRTYSLFNQSLYARLNTEVGTVAYGRGKLVRRDVTGTLSRTAIEPDRLAETLTGQFGYSAAIVAMLPPDEEGDAFL